MAKRLQVSRDDAKSLIHAQIEKGSEIRSSKSNTREEGQSALKAYYRWHAYVHELLQKVFESEEYPHKFNEMLSEGIDLYIVNVSQYNPAIDGAMGREIEFLESVIERIDLFDEIAEIRQKTATNSNASDKSKVFVVHGRNEPVRASLFGFLRAIGLHPVEWSEAIIATGEASPYVGMVLDIALSQAQAVVVLLTPDDEARLLPGFHGANEPEYERLLTGQPRPNVLFEAGMAMGTCASRTILVEVGALRPFSDVGGRHLLRLDNSVAKRQQLAQRLKISGCPVNLDGTDWHGVGDFSIVTEGDIDDRRTAGSTSMRSPDRENDGDRALEASEKLEKNLYELLSLLRKSVDSTQITINKGGTDYTSTGLTALKEWGNLLGVIWNTSKESDVFERLDAAMETFLSASSQFLDHWYRTFAYAAKLIESSEVEEKAKYFDLLFSSLSTYEVTILFYRGLSKFGNDVAPFLPRLRSLLRMDHLLDQAFEPATRPSAANADTGL